METEFLTAEHSATGHVFRGYDAMLSGKDGAGRKAGPGARAGAAYGDDPRGRDGAGGGPGGPGGAARGPPRIRDRHASLSCLSSPAQQEYREWLRQEEARAAAAGGAPPPKTKKR